MSVKIHGFLNLSKIPKELIVTNSKGEKGVWIDILEQKNGQDQYGNTHTIQIYDKATKQKHYIANLKTQEFGNGGSAPQTPKPVDEDNDLPWD